MFKNSSCEAEAISECSTSQAVKSDFAIEMLQIVWYRASQVQNLVVPGFTGSDLALFYDKYNFTTWDVEHFILASTSQLRMLNIRGLLQLHSSGC